MLLRSDTANIFFEFFSQEEEGNTSKAVFDHPRLNQTHSNEVVDRRHCKSV